MTDHYICHCGAEYVGPDEPADDFTNDELHDEGCAGPWMLVPDWFTDPAADVLARFTQLFHIAVLAYGVLAIEGKGKAPDELPPTLQALDDYLGNDIEDDIFNEIIANWESYHA